MYALNQMFTICKLEGYEMLLKKVDLKAGNLIHTQSLEGEHKVKLDDYTFYLGDSTAMATKVFRKVYLGKLRVPRKQAEAPKPAKKQKKSFTSKFSKKKMSKKS